MTTTIIIPCYNEEGRLPIERYRKFMNLNKDIHFVFVNDGSQDRTQLLLAGFHNQFPDQVQVVDLKVNQGKAEAVRQGIKSSLEHKPDIVGFWDADLATPLSAILDFLKVFQEKPQIKWVFGSRVQLLGHQIKRKMTRHYFGRVFATAASIVLRIPIYDTQCGAKLFRCDDLLEAVVSERFKTKWIFDVELIARLIKTTGNRDLPNRIIYEHPLAEWTDIEGSKLKLSDFFKAIKDLIILWLYLGKKPYSRA